MSDPTCEECGHLEHDPGLCEHVFPKEGNCLCGMLSLLAKDEAEEERKRTVKERAEAGRKR